MEEQVAQLYLSIHSFVYPNLFLPSSVPSRGHLTVNKKINIYCLSAFIQVERKNKKINE